MPYSNYGYFDPIHIIWRNGTDDDPYVDRIEYLKILNNKIVLSEIPDRFTRVKIAGMIEINYDGTPRKSINPNEFSVNYSTGIVQFHPSKESGLVNVMYKGKGFIQYPSSRIYHQDEMSGIVETLDKIIDNAKSFIHDASVKVSDYEAMRDIVNDRIANAQTAIEESRHATDESIIATDKALDAYETTRLVFLPYVMTKEEIATKYPNPEIGHTVQVYDTGERFRYDGIEWIPIDLFGGAIPLADETIDGLMSSEDYMRLRNIDEATYSKRALVFVLPSYPMVGVQPIVARFPFNGKIIGAKALCGVLGETDTEIAIEKSRDMVNWTQITGSNLTMKSGQYFDDGTINFSDDTVFEGDLFRLVVIQQGVNVQHITFEVIIETTI